MSDQICFFNQLTLQWGNEPLWSDLNATLPAGLTALVGPNGHGKSALLGVLAGRHPPTQGQVTWSVPFYYQAQLDPLAGPRVAEALGVGLQFDAFTRLERGEAEPSDLEQVADHWHRPGEWAKRLTEAGLAPDLSLPVDALSGGQRTRLALCRALLHAGRYLLLDEPSNHLDSAGRRWLLQALAAHPGGALVVSHDRTLLNDVGRGKSLLLKCLAGWRQPRAGECEVRGSVRYLDQHFTELDPTASALENLQRGQPERPVSACARSWPACVRAVTRHCSRYRRSVAVNV